MARRLVAVLVIAAFAGGAGTAFADIDPASDVLPLQDVFLPYSPKVCPQLSAALRKVIVRSRRAGYPVKVAVIASKADLGGASQLFGDPQAYARFLAQELVTYAPTTGTTYHNTPLLVTMPAGFGLAHGGAKAEQVMKDLSISSSRPNELARSSFEVIPKLAAAEGHRVTAPAIRPGCSSDSGGGTSVLVFIAPLVLLLGFAIVAAARGRLRRS